MILSASRRTDIPAFYSDWLMERLKAGYVLVRNPMNHAQISRITLSPDIVDCIVFWTKDPQNMLDKLPVLDKMGYRYYFQFTLTPYDKTIEKNLRDQTEIESTFIELSRDIGSERVIWRYDPIILNHQIDIAFHKEQFERLCEKLYPYTKTVIISFVDMYHKLKTNLIHEITIDEMIELSAFIGQTAAKYDLTARACCEAFDFTLYGIQQSHCIDAQLIERICGGALDIKQDKFQRANCGCVQSIDIGAYNTCVNGCVYCYANHSLSNAVKNYQQHDSQNELLMGTISNDTKIIERKVSSNIDGQIKLL